MLGSSQQAELPANDGRTAGSAPAVIALGSRIGRGSDGWSRSIGPFLTSRPPANIRPPSKHGASGSLPRLPPLPESCPGRDGNWRRSRTSHSPSSRPLAAGRYGFRTGCRDWTWRMPWRWWNCRCTSTGPHPGARSTCGRAPTGHACTRPSCKKEGPPTSSPTSTARCSPTCGMSWSSRERSGPRGRRWSRHPARRRDDGGRRPARTAALPAGGGQDVLRAARQQGLPAGRGMCLACWCRRPLYATDAARMRA
jgi:hypothetical protein